MKVIYSKDGAVLHPDTHKEIGGWEREGNPHARLAGHRNEAYLVWLGDRRPETPKRFFPRYMANYLFPDDEGKICIDQGYRIGDYPGEYTKNDMTIKTDTPGYYSLYRGKDFIAHGDVDEIIEASNAADPLLEITFRPMEGDEVVRHITNNDQEDTYERLKYLHPSSCGQEDHYVAVKDNRLIADFSVKRNREVTSDLVVRHVVVDPEYRGRGLARALITYAFEQIRRERYQWGGAIRTLTLSSFTQEGRERIKHVMEENAHLLGHIEMVLSEKDQELERGAVDLDI